MNIRKKVGENLKAARKATGYTQKEVAAMLHKYQPDYCQYEKGQVELDYEKIIFLCKTFDITPNDLFDMEK
ncbi:MAG: helix-turn-helix transcriptional regulator [Clostridia bacterium]|nr:helix-turn-helix transcriptional regulator [Clostridia bacterium]